MIISLFSYRAEKNSISAKMENADEGKNLLLRGNFSVVYRPYRFCKAE